MATGGNRSFISRSVIAQFLGDRGLKSLFTRSGLNLDNITDMATTCQKALCLKGLSRVKIKWSS